MTCIAGDPGIVLYIDPANPLSYPGSGKYIYDLSVNQNILVMDDDMTWDSEGYISGGGISEATAQKQSRIGKQISYSAFFRTDFTSSGEKRVIYGFGGQLGFRFPAKRVGCLISTSGFSGWNSSQDFNYPFIENHWHQLVFTYRDGVSSYYIDGILEKRHYVFTGIPTATTTFLRIGGSTGSYFPGDIGVCQVHSRCLNEKEVMRNFNTFKGIYGL